MARHCTARFSASSSSSDIVTRLARHAETLPIGLERVALIVEVVKHLYLEGGVRRLAVDVSAEVLDHPEVSRKPGVWDPVVGMTYRRPMGEHWLLSLHGDGGGFGVGSEVDLNAAVTLDWRMARHFGLTLGYGALYFRLQDTWVDSTRIEKSLELGTTLHGPILGFKLLF